MKEKLNQTSLEGMISRAYRDFGTAVSREDYYDSVKKLGVLEFLNVPDIANHTGLVYMLGGEYKKAVECFKKIDRTSVFFEGAQRSLATAYMYLGDYVQLDALFSRTSFEISEIDEMDMRLKCLGHMSVEYMDAKREQITSAKPRVVHSLVGKDDVSFYSVCQMLANSLVAAGECIHQCFLYWIRNGKDIDIENTIDTEAYIRQYEKWVLILSYSRYIKGIKLPPNIESLAICALFDKSWKDRLEIFSSTNYVQQIVQLIFNLGRPEMYPNIAPYTAVKNILEQMIHICPQAVAQIVNHYFSVIAEAYQNDSGTAAQYLGYVYAEILALDSDPYQLKERIEQIRILPEEHGVDEIVARIKLAKSMSRKGHDALLNALSAFYKSSEKVAGANDYSALALQFFRVLEIEYCEKLLRPLVSLIDIDQFKAYAEACTNERNQKGWLQDVAYLSRIVNGEQESFEIGKIRTLLAKLNGYYTQNDDCAVYLRKIIYSILTPAGQNALHSKKMLDVVGKNPVEKYRIPGAHTGYLPYSVACDAKDHVMNNLFEVVSWFN